MTTNVGNRPTEKLDPQGRGIYDSVDDLSFRGDYTGTNLIYKGFAKPGSATSAAVWQIAKMAYDGSNNLTSITWPQDLNSHASSDYQFVWDSRAGYTYS